METDNFDGFEALWQRVQCPDETQTQALWQPLPADGEIRMLEKYMDDEAASAAAYRALYKRWQGSFCAAGFAHMAKDEERHLRRLEGAYFLITGDSYAPKMPGKIDTDMPDALRRAWHEEQKASRAYRAATQQAQLPALERMFSQLSEDEDSHATQLFGMIQRLMQ